MSQAKPILESFLEQAIVAAELINSLESAAQFSQQGQTQKSIENAIQTLLAPLQPVQVANKSQSNDSFGTTGTAENGGLTGGTAGTDKTFNSAEAVDPRLDPNWCEECQVVHSQPANKVDELVGLLTLLSMLKGRKPKAE